MDTTILGRWQHNAVLSLLLGLLVACNPALAQNDVTAHVERLGNAWQETYKTGPQVYARNVWDLQAYEGRLYIGGGNSSNCGPARNAGPVPVCAWDPISKKFRQEFIVDDEQIDVYYVFGNHLYTPGHDPRESWDLGNFYRLENGTWKKHRNIPGAIHTYAMHSANGVLFAGLGVIEGAAVAFSRDEGKSWTKKNLGGRRVHAFLDAAGVVHSMDVFAGPALKSDPDWPGRGGVVVHEFDGKADFHERPDLTQDLIFPGLELRGQQRAKVVKPVSWQTGSVYIGAYVHNDHQFMPLGVYFAKNLARGSVDVRTLTLPGKTRPWDVIVNNGDVYILLEKSGKAGKIIEVVRTTDFKTISEVLRFSAPTYARSFEFLHGDLYFGLGCEVKDPQKWNQNELHPDTGQILRVKAKHFRLSITSKAATQPSD